MHRSLLAVAALLGMSLGIAHADFIILKVNMGVSPTNVVAPPPKPGDQPGMMGYPGYPGMNPGMYGMYGQPMYGPGGMGSYMLKLKGQPKPEVKIDPRNLMTIVVFFEYSKAVAVPVANLPPGMVITKVRHKWGDTFILNDDKFVQVMPPIKKPTAFQQYENKRKDMGVGKEKSPAKYLELAQFALSHGLHKQCNEVMDELIKMDPKDKELATAVKAFVKVREDLTKQVSRDDGALSWNGLLNYKVDRSAPHYCLLYDAAGPAEVKSRAQRLEQNMEAFYYWFALRGKTLPVPDRRLVAVLIEKPADFRSVHLACGGPAVVADGFYGQRDNIAVFSSNRLDPNSDLFNRHCTELIQQGWDMKNIMNPKLSKPPPGKFTTPQEMAHVHTMAVIKKALEEESEISTTSHEGSRQLLAAIGLLPRSVQVPEWIQFGWASFFETPKYDPITHTGAFWPGTGAPSWTYLVQWKLWEGERQLDDPVEALENVLTDRYFNDAKYARDPMALIKARTYAWALTYYLSQRQLDGLLRYGQELSLLPRDLEFDGDVQLGCFARSFGIAEGKGVNDVKFEALAKDWYKFIGLEPMQVPELLQKAQEVLRERKAKPPLPPAPAPAGK